MRYTKRPRADVKRRAFLIGAIMTTLNDYIDSTKTLLKRYHIMQDKLQELGRKRTALAAKISEPTDIAPSIANYGGMPSSRTGNSSPVEAIVDRRIDNVYKLQEISTAYKSIACTLETIDTALHGLTEDDSTAIVLYYIEGMTWTQVADKLGRSRKWCSIVGNNAIVKLSLLLYGSPRAVKTFSNAGIYIEREAI